MSRAREEGQLDVDLVGRAWVVSPQVDNAQQWAPKGWTEVALETRKCHNGHEGWNGNEVSQRSGR